MTIIGWILIITALVFSIANYKKRPTLSRIILTILLIIAESMAALIGLLMIAFSAAVSSFIAILSTAFIIFLLSVFGFALNIFFFKKKKLRNILIVTALIAILAFGGTYLWQQADAAIPTVNDGSAVIYRYDPLNSNSLVKTLNEEPTFKFTEPVFFDGATALYPVYAAFANETFVDGTISFDATEEYLKCSKTIDAYKAIVTGDADIIFVAGASEQQMAYAEEQGVTLEFTPIGKEAFVFFVNQKNALDDITIEQIQGIYSGEITQWNQLGLKNNDSIRAYQRPEGSGSQTALQKLMGDIPLIEPEKNNEVALMGEIIEEVASYKNYKSAFGYSFRFYTTEMIANNDIKLLSINGIAPTKENIINETYPITSTFYAVTRSDASSEIKEFVQWCLSDQGQYLIEQTGYVGIN